MYNPYNPEANNTNNTINESIRNFKKFLIHQKIAGGSIRSYLSDTRFFFNWLTEFLLEKRILNLNETIDDRKWKVGVENRKSKIDNLSSTFNPQPLSSPDISRDPASGGDIFNHPSSNNFSVLEDVKSEDKKWEMSREVSMRSEERTNSTSLPTPDALLTSHPHILSLLKFVNEAVLNAYKDSLETGNAPVKTINRRFSALRKFGSFCLTQNWLPSAEFIPSGVERLRTSIFDTLRNISPNTPFPESVYHLGEFKADLWKDNSTRSTIKNYLNDARQFISWSNTRINTNANTK